MQIFLLFIVRDKCIGPPIYPPSSKEWNPIIQKVILLKKSYGKGSV